MAKITSDDVNAAKDDECSKKIIYDKIFFDEIGNPVVFLWLKRIGVHTNDIDNLLSDINNCFWESVLEYKHEKIPFEMFVWTYFKTTVSSFYHRKKAKKLSMINIGLVDKNGNGVEVYDVGELTDDVTIDFETVVGMLPSPAPTIARCLFYSGWNGKEIREYYGMDYDEYYKNLGIVKKAVSQYLLGDL